MTAAVSAVGLWLATWFPAQDVDVRTRWSAVEADLAALDTRGERIDRLFAFLREAAPDHPRAFPVLEARCRLASELLIAFRPEAAGEQFDAVLELAPPTAIDLRGRALYGRAQVDEVLGRKDRARKALEQLRTEFLGTRWADDATVALQHLGYELRNGEPAPEFEVVHDLGHRAHRLAEFRGGPVLLVFFDPYDPEGLVRIDGLLDAAETCGLAPDRVLAFALDRDDDAALRRKVRERGWKVPVVALGRRGFLSDAMLRYGVRALPSTFLIGSDGHLVGRDLTPHRLRRLFREDD